MQYNWYTIINQSIDLALSYLKIEDLTKINDITIPKPLANPKVDIPRLSNNHTPNEVNAIQQNVK